MQVKIGAVPYLNARPLVRWLEQFPQPGVEIVFAHPTELIPALLAGELSVAMASTFALLDNPELLLLGGLGITTCGRAASVRLISKVAPEQISSLALDNSSRSSVALARIILADSYGVIPVVHNMPPDLTTMLSAADAAVLIGDIGLTVSAESCYDIDLGEAWWKLTKLPFYFAGWIARDEAELQQLAPMLYQAAAEGLAYLPEIVKESALAMNISEELCRDYLQQVMNYRTGEKELAGLQEFARRSATIGLIPQTHEIKYWTFR